MNDHQDEHPEDDQDDWEEVWDARLAALSGTFAAEPSQVLHAPHPFELGGNADVLAFPIADGTAYVTAELTGKPDACYADYELMICERSTGLWGANVISRLAAYTQQAHIGPGESMDIASAVPEGASIQAFLFDTYASLELFGAPVALRLCIGITQAELQYKMEHGPERLLAALKRHGVYPFTELARESVPLDA
jgi:hypothetical protein